MLLDEKVALLAETLAAADVPHAFGGAIALAYYATPRGTQDVDINVFLPTSAFDRVLEAPHEVVDPPEVVAGGGAVRRDPRRGDPTGVFTTRDG